MANNDVGAGPSSKVERVVLTMCLALAAVLIVVAGVVVLPVAVQTPAVPVAPTGLPTSSTSAETLSSASDKPVFATISAMAVLNTLQVRGRAPKTGYSRDSFGNGWVDTDRNGCDTRNDILNRDLANVSWKAGTRMCVVLTGTLRDPYSGNDIAFLRGEKTSNDVQVDHVVALSDAWQKGAQSWDATKRAAFANDPLELLAVDGPLNEQKGAGDAATWLPPATSYRCAYVARQVAVKAVYGLWVTPAERDAIGRVLATCPDQTVAPNSSPSAVITVAPQPTSDARAITPGAYCRGENHSGFSKMGHNYVCRYQDGDVRLRWRRV